MFEIRVGTVSITLSGLLLSSQNKTRLIKTQVLKSGRGTMRQKRTLINRDAQSRLPHKNMEQPRVTTSRVAPTIVKLV
jgi:hypothetical protein